MSLLPPTVEEFETFVAQIKSWAGAHPEAVFAVLRRIRPIFLHNGQAIVTRYRDVQEVLSRNEVFETTYETGFKAITGGSNFFLGMDNTPTYTRDVSNMRSVVRREDIPTRVGAFVTSIAERFVTAAPGTIDVVDLGEAVLTAWVADYFGISSPTTKAFAQWSATMSAYLFLQGQPGAPSEQLAVEAGKKMRDEIDRQIAARKASRMPSRDDVLERCLVMQAAGLPGTDDVTLRNNLLGVIVGAIPTSVAAITRAIDELLRRPEELAAAQAAARDNNDALVERYVFEALRFNPIGPGVIRVARRDYELAAGTLHAHVIPQGTTVVAAIQSAMFDGEAVQDPEEFKVDRPPYLSMIFGYGLHTCLGQYINVVQIPAVVKALLKRANLRRSGELVLDGPFPSHLRVDFDSAQPTSLPPERTVGGGLTANAATSTPPAGMPSAVFRQLRFGLVLGAMVDVFGGLPLMLAPAFMERFLRLPVPPTQTHGNLQFWPAYAAVFLFVLPVFYVLTAANPQRYLGNVVVSCFGRTMGALFYATYYFQFNGHFPFVILSALNLGFAIYYAWCLIRSGGWNVMEALAPGSSDRQHS